jgi:hypothetical protein
MWFCKAQEPELQGDGSKKLASKLKSTSDFSVNVSEPTDKEVRNAAPTTLAAQMTLLSRCLRSQRSVWAVWRILCSIFATKGRLRTWH